MPLQQYTPCCVWSEQACHEFYNGGCCRQVLGLIDTLNLTKLCMAYELV